MSGLAFSFTDLFASVSGGDWQTPLKNKLKDAQLNVESKIGVFLTTGATIRDAKARAQQQQNSSKKDVKDQATALVATANGLLQQFDNIHVQATDLLSKLADLQAQFSTSDILKTANPQSMGSRVVELFNQKNQEILEAISSAGQLVLRMQAHVNDTNKLVSNVKNLEQYAAGNGSTAFLNNLASGAANNIIAPVAKVAVIGLLAYLLLPSLIARGAKSVVSRS